MAAMAARRCSVPARAARRAADQAARPKPSSARVAAPTAAPKRAGSVLARASASPTEEEDYSTLSTGGVDPQSLDPITCERSAAQMRHFKGLLETREHAFTYLGMFSGCSGEQCSVRFTMGGPRLDGSADVRRVTEEALRAVSPSRAPHVRLVRLDTGDTAAEVTFPLGAPLATASATSKGVVADADAELMHSMLDELEALAVYSSVVCLLEKGSDDRSVFTGPDRLNKYHTGMRALAEGVTHRGSCTSSSPTPGGLDAARVMATRLWEGHLESDYALMGEVRARVLAALGVDPDEAELVLHPSGTDAESVPLVAAVLASRRLRRERGNVGDACRGRVTSVVACAGEVGSGTENAAMGRFFSSLCPLGGAAVANGEELPAMHGLAEMDVVPVVARDADGGGIRADFDDACEAACREALDADDCAVVVLHTVAGSKTGLCAPDESVTARLKREYGEHRVVAVLDACQMRQEPSLLRRWAREHGHALITASKFFAGPSFSGGVLLGRGAAAQLNEDLEVEGPKVVAALANAMAGYLTRHDVGESIPLLRKALPYGPCNAGLLLRWAAGLHEMEGLAAAAAAAGGEAEAAAATGRWVRAVRAEAASHEPYLSTLPMEDYPDGGWQNGGINSIVSVRARAGGEGPWLGVPQLKVVYDAMFEDASRALPACASAEERRVCARRFLLGQPVPVPGNAVLRTCMGAPQLTELLQTGDLEGMLEDDKDLLAKYAALVKYFDDVEAWAGR